jgi:phosphohistidine phosphatase
LVSDARTSVISHPERSFTKNLKMKKLILVRHGKAEDAGEGMSDLERSLTLKGKTVSKLMAEKLGEKEKSEVTIITSPAFRAVETALIFAGELAAEPDKIVISSDLYYKMNLRHLPGILSGAGDKSDTLVLFGHNPSFTDVANSLASQGCDFISKSGVVCISFDIARWSEIKHKKGKLEYHLKPEKVL